MRNVSRPILGAAFAIGALGVAAYAVLAPMGATAQQRPPASAKPAPAPAPSSTQRIETITYEFWTLTCRDAVGGGKKICSAVLTIQAAEQGRRQVLGAWTIGRNGEGHLMTVLQTPQVELGVLIEKGVEFKLGTAAPRKLNYVTCSTRQCESSLMMDAGVVKDALAAPNATITIYSTDGKAININMTSIKGTDKVMAAIGK